MRQGLRRLMREPSRVRGCASAACEQVKVTAANLNNALRAARQNVSKSEADCRKNECNFLKS